MDLIISNDKIAIEEESVKNKRYQLLKKIEIPFSEYVETAKRRKSVPYIKGKCRVPKKYQDSNELLYGWNSKGYLVNKLTGEVLVSNPKVAGTPRRVKVNGNDIYNNHVSKHARAALVKALHKQFARYIRDIKPLKDIKSFPLGLHLSFKVHDMGSHNLDNDNRWIWRKAIQDTMTQEGVIPEDNPYIVWENLERTIFIPDTQEQTIIIEIFGYA